MTTELFQIAVFDSDTDPAEVLCSNMSLDEAIDKAKEMWKSRAYFGVEVISQDPNSQDPIQWLKSSSEVLDNIQSSADDEADEFGEQDIREEFNIPEKILCAAIMFKGTIISAFRHRDCYKVLRRLGYSEHELPGREAQGFLTSHNRYVGRAEAFKIAKERKQIIHTMFDGDDEGSLTSEDLY